MLARLAAAAAVVTLGFGVAQAQTPAYPEIADVSHATPDVAKTLRAFFVAKSTHKAADMMTHFSKDGVSISTPARATAGPAGTP